MDTKNTSIKTLSLIALCFLASCSKKTEKTDEEPPIVIRLVLAEKCEPCHSKGIAQGGFGIMHDLDLMIASGYINPGHGKDSLLYQKISETPPFGDRMPPKGPYLTIQEVALVETWIDNLSLENETLSNIETVSKISEVSYTVTPEGSSVTLSPTGTQIVMKGDVVTFVVTPNSNSTLSTIVEGTCPLGSWDDSTYTSGEILEDCSIIFSANSIPFEIDPSLFITPSGSHLSITPNTIQTVEKGQAFAFIVTADSGYTLSTTVGGDCPSGAWNESIYTTGGILNDCSAQFSVLGQHTVTVSGNNITIDPNGTRSVDDGLTQAFFVATDSTHSISNTVAGDCPSGIWNSSTYTTGAIVADCLVSFQTTLKPTVTPSGTHVTISPSTVQSVTSGSTKSFAISTSNQFTRSDTVTGTCPAGSWSGNTYTTGAVTTNCTVIFSAGAINPCPTVISNVSFATDIAPLFQSPQNGSSKSCLTCHGASGASGSYSMTSNGTSASYSLITALIGNGNHPGEYVVISGSVGDVTNSWLYKKTTSSISPATGSRMPIIGSGVTSYWTITQQSQLCNWIYQGALDN